MLGGRRYHCRLGSRRDDKKPHIALQLGIPPEETRHRPLERHRAGLRMNTLAHPGLQSGVLNSQHCHRHGHDQQRCHRVGPTHHIRYTRQRQTRAHTAQDTVVVCGHSTQQSTGGSHTAALNTRSLDTHNTHRSLPPLEYELVAARGPPCLRFKPSLLQYTGGGGPSSLQRASLLSPVQRIGDILCHDRTLAAAMLFPQHSSLVLLGSANPSLVASDRALLSDPASILFVLDDQAIMASPYHISALLRAALPQQHAPTTQQQSRQQHHPSPITLLAWKIETPARTIAYTGTQEQLARADLTRPHTLGPKVLLSERSKRPTPASITVVPPADQLLPLGDLVRSSLLQQATASPPTKHSPASLLLTTHALEEAIACFVHAPPAHNDATVPLGASTQWDRDYIDCR